MLRRNIREPLERALTDTPVALLVGARQSGKSTLARTLVAPENYVTLDDATTLAAAKTDPAAFIGHHNERMVIDEVQRVPELLLALKSEVDRRRKPGRFLLTGSANVFALPRVADSLAGRLEILTLWPLSQGEVAGEKDDFISATFGARLPGKAEPVIRRNAIERIVRGGYPEAYARDDDRRRAWFGSYITAILQRDIRDFAHVEGLTDLPRLLTLLAARLVSLLNLADVSRGLGVPYTTLRRYVALLENTFIVQQLPAWSSNLGRRLVKAPKLLFGDTGLAASLLGLTVPRLEADPIYLGPLVENFVAMELRKQSAWSRTRVGLFHFRAQSGQEVDLVLEDASGRLVGIEVKAASGVTGDDFAGLSALAMMTGKRFHRGLVLYLGERVVAFGSRLHAVPLSALWGWD